MNCIECSACCRAFGVYELTPADMRRVPKSLSRKSHLYRKGGVMQTDDFTCKALTKQGCSIYAIRPAVCRRFEVDSEECRMAQKWVKEHECRLTKSIASSAKKG